MTISARAHVAGVMGWPIGHSLSPRLHGYWLREYGIDGAYVPMLVNPDDAASVIRALPKMGFAGTNVTIPHKEVALATVDEADERARRDRFGQHHRLPSGRQSVGYQHRRFRFHGKPQGSPTRLESLRRPGGRARRRRIFTRRLRRVDRGRFA